MSRLALVGLLATACAGNVERDVTPWLRLHDAREEAFAFAGGTRAIVGDRLLTADGRVTPLSCHVGGIGAGLRATPDGALLCVSLTGRGASVAHLDDDGGEVSRSEVGLPVRLPPGRAEIFAAFIGFLPGGLVFSFQLVIYDEIFNGISPKNSCEVYVFDGQDQWTWLGAFVYRDGEGWRCNFPSGVNAAIGSHIVDGGRPRDAQGSPNP